MKRFAVYYDVCRPEDGMRVHKQYVVVSAPNEDGARTASIHSLRGRFKGLFIRPTAVVTAEEAHAAYLRASLLDDGGEAG